jgi:hypothetical protein
LPESDDLTGVSVLLARLHSAIVPSLPDISRPSPIKESFELMWELRLLYPSFGGNGIRRTGLRCWAMDKTKATHLEERKLVPCVAIEGRQ